MSRFYAEIAGQARTHATRRGSVGKPCTGHVRGWDVGVAVECAIVDGRDVIRVYRTGGSNRPAKRDLVAEIS